jgi:hypothetical protein
MKWQDIVFTIGNIVFIVALVPSIMGKAKPALSTSLMTGTFMAIFALTYITLGLWFSSIATFCGAAAWLVLAAQKYRQGRPT